MIGLRGDIDPPLTFYSLTCPYRVVSKATRAQSISRGIGALTRVEPKPPLYMPHKGAVERLHPITLTTSDANLFNADEVTATDHRLNVRTPQHIFSFPFSPLQWPQIFGKTSQISLLVCCTLSKRCFDINTFSTCLNSTSTMSIAAVGLRYTKIANEPENILISLQ